MCPRILPLKLALSILLLLSRSSALQVKESEQVKYRLPDDQERPAVEFFEESSSDDQVSPQSMTTTESVTTIETYRELTLPVTGDSNVSKYFRPSIHLGEIKESRISNNPFNNLQHIRFENELGPASHHPVNDHEVIYQPGYYAGQPVRLEPQGTYLGSLNNVVESLEKDNRHETGKDVFVKFQDEAVDLPRFHHEDLTNHQAYHQQYAHSVVENVDTQYELPDQQVFQDSEKLVDEQIGKDYQQFLGKPSKFQSDGERHEVGSLINADPSKTQYYAGLYDQSQAHQQSQQGFDVFKGSHDGAVYVHESSFTRTKKFPYPFHQPPVGYHQAELINDQRSSYPLKARVSPWRKILHLIGAFLPIGLLVAALTPNVVKVNNTTDPNIVLSKWRAADLPVEHKQARFDDSSSICEERSICDMILAGGEAGSNVLLNILWNLATRTSTAVAKECGLQEIFEAAKKKDCTIVTC